jgi:signal transduction histidine kinase
MRQPVATIIALAEAALSNDEIPLGVRRRLGQVMDQAEWLGEMLRHLIEPAANGAVNGTAEGEFHDLVLLTRGVVQIEMATYPGDLALQWGSGNMCVAGNGVELRRAITNLLSNATRAAGPEGKVAVCVRRAAGRVLLTVDDSGPGFGLIRQDVGLGLLAVAHGLASYGGSLEFSRSQMGGVRAVLALRAADPPISGAITPM